jgi:hypothetical protein
MHTLCAWKPHYIVMRLLQCISANCFTARMPHYLERERNRPEAASNGFVVVMASSDEPIDFRVDRPFIFVISSLIHRRPGIEYRERQYGH